MGRAGHFTAHKDLDIIFPGYISDMLEHPYNGRVNLKDSYARIDKGEVFVHQMHIGPYPFAHYGNHDPLRTRKLLLHKYEIKRLIGKVNEKGFSLVPLKIYFQKGKAKMTLALARGKQKYDKRETIRRRDEKRDLQRDQKTYRF